MALIFFVVILCSCIFNFTTLGILNSIAPESQVQKLCYQEVSYFISRGNRGYIFLISAAKTFLLLFTSSLAINYIASTLANFVVHSLDSSATTEWAVYIGFVLLVSIMVGIIFFMQDKTKGVAGISLYWAYAFCLLFLISFLTIFCVLLWVSISNLTKT